MQRTLLTIIEGSGRLLDARELAAAAFQIPRHELEAAQLNSTRRALNNLVKERRIVRQNWIVATNCGYCTRIGWCSKECVAVRDTAFWQAMHALSERLTSP